MFLKDTDIGRLIMEDISPEKTAMTKKPYVNIADAKKVSAGLSKIAEFPYKEKTYGSVQAMIKMASECISNLIKSLESIKERNGDLEKAAEVRILIDDMVKIGAVDEYNAHEKIADLMGKTTKQLEVIKEAMAMVKNNGKERNIFFEIDKEATSSEPIKKGMFDDVISC